MALVPPPPWMDQVLFNLQAPEVHAKLSSWEKEFLESISKQYSNWRESATKMSFGTDRQRLALLNIHNRHCPQEHKSWNTFKPFEE